MSDSGRLQEWLRRQVAAGLPAIAGARVTGTIPMQVSLVNDLIAQALAEAGNAAPRDGSRPAAPIDVASIARMVRQLRVDAAPGVITLDFEVGIDG